MSPDLEDRDRCHCSGRVLGREAARGRFAPQQRGLELVLFQAAASCPTGWISVSRPVSTSKTKPRTGTSFAIQGWDRTFSICSRVFCSGSLYEKKRIGAGEGSPVAAATVAFSSSSVKVVNPHPVWFSSMISLDPSTRVETTSSPSTSSVTAGPPVRITSMSACGSPSIPVRSERRGSIQVTTAIFGAGRFPRLTSYFFEYSRFASSALSMIVIVRLPVCVACRVHAIRRYWLESLATIGSEHQCAWRTIGPWYRRYLRIECARPQSPLECPGWFLDAVNESDLL